MQCLQCKGQIEDGFKFCGNCGHKVSDDPAPTLTREIVAPVYSDERREVAVLFADVKGFTSMCENMDPEEVHAVMNECFAGLGRGISEEGGHIDKYIGDNVMALFGAPVAHEDDASRACRAALEMQCFLKGFAEEQRETTGVTLQMRIGIHCGLVISGGVGSSEVRKDYSVMGDTVNLASRMESSALPGTILVSAETAARTQGCFQFGPIQELTVKGKAEPVKACELLSELSEIALRGRDGFSVELAGRDSDLKQLRRWGNDPIAENRWIEVSGEMGLGKTRLLEEVKAALKAPYIKIVGTPIAQRRPFGLVRRLIHEILISLSDEALVPATREEFEKILLTLSGEIEPFIDALWFVSPPSQVLVEPPDPDPQILRAMVESGVAVMLRCYAIKHPDSAFVLDSFELSDKESELLFESLGVRADNAGVKFIVTSRPEGRTSISSDKELRLKPLDPDSALTLLDALCRETILPEGLKSDILNRANGNPLFIEEMVRSVLSNEKLVMLILSPGWESRDGRCFQGGKHITIELPASIRTAMVARLDKLSAQQREFLSQCAVQGVEFHLDVVKELRQAVTPGAADTASLIEELESQEIIKDITIAQRKRMHFVRPVMQEGCYATLLLRQRRLLHRETARAISRVVGDVDSVSPELLAYHYQQAQDWSDAAAAHMRLADHYADLFLNEKAIESYQDAIRAVEAIRKPTNQEQRIKVSAAGETAKIYLRIGSYEKAKSAAIAMQEQATRNDDRAEAKRLIAAAELHTGDIANAKLSLQSALQLVREKDANPIVETSVLFDLAELSHRANDIEQAHRYLKECRDVVPTENFLMGIRLDTLHGTILHSQGRFNEAAECYQHAYRCAEEKNTVSEKARALNSLGNVARDRGHYDAAKEKFEEALKLWQRAGSAHCISGAHNNLGNLAMSQGDFTNARHHQTLAYEASKKIGNVFCAAMAQANLAYLSVEEGNSAEALRLAKEALVELGSSSPRLRALILVVLGEAYLETNQLEQSKTIFDEVSSNYDQDKNPLAIAATLRGLGRLALLAHDVEQSLTLLTQSEEIFKALTRHQEAARTLLYKASALHKLDKSSEAKETVNAAISIFEEIKAHKDSERAQELLKRIGSSG